MVTIPQRLLGEALKITAGKYPAKTAVVVKDQSYTYQMLLDGAEKIAAYLIHAGIKKGDRVAIYMSNSWESVLAIYGVTLSGGVFLFVNPQTKASKLQYILNDCGAKILLAESVLKNEFLPAVQDVPTLDQVIFSGAAIAQENTRCSFTAFESITASEKIPVQFPLIIPNDLASLIYTSGSTGKPKGVLYGIIEEEKEQQHAYQAHEDHQANIKQEFGQDEIAGGYYGIIIQHASTSFLQKTLGNGVDANK